MAYVKPTMKTVRMSIEDGCCGALFSISGPGFNASFGSGQIQ